MEFLTTDAGSAEPEEVLPGEADRGDADRSRRTLAIGALVLVGAALVARAVTDKHDGKPAATRSTSAAPTSAVPAPAVAPASVRPQDLRECPLAGDGQSSCISTRRVPTQTIAAVLEVFPRARTTYILDERVRDTGLGGGAIWYREVRLRQGTKQISIVMHRKITDDIDTAYVNDDGSRSVLAVDHPLGPLQLSIRVVAPSGVALDPAPTTRLSADRRLITLP